MFQFTGHAGQHRSPSSGLACPTSNAPKHQPTRECAVPTVRCTLMLTIYCLSIDLSSFLLILLIITPLDSLKLTARSVSRWSDSAHTMRWLRVVHHVLKTLAYASCAVGCLYQCASILKIYFSFPSTVTSTVEVMDTLTLPAMTICNNNRIMLSKLKASDPSFASQWDELVARLRKRVQVSQTKLVIS